MGLGGLVVLLALLAFAAPASAHPLGNFTVNRYARIEVGATVVRVHYVLDEAELVAVAESDALAHEGEASYRARRVEEIRRGLRLELAGRAAPLRIVDSRLTQPPGQGGLTTLRIEAVYEATVSGRSKTALSFVDENEPDRIGWREVLASTTSGARIADDGRVARVDRSDALRRYPSDPGVAPLRESSASFSFVPGSGHDASGAVDADRVGDRASSGDRLAGLVARTSSSPLAIALAVLAAVAFGAIHALGPGHGKTVMAAYLVSTRGRRRDAVALGVVVSVMHTASVLILALVLAAAGERVDVSRTYPALTVVAGVLVAAVGVRLLLRRSRASRSPVDALDDHDHSHDHVHGHDHVHDHEHRHAHRSHASSAAVAVAALDRPATAHTHGGRAHTHELPDDVRPLSRAGVIALGSSGGLFPSPSAVLVLIGAFAVGRGLFGLALVGAFSVGLAAVLVGVGLLLVAGGERLRASRLSIHLTWLPIASAAALCGVGVMLVGQGVAGLR